MAKHDWENIRGNDKKYGISFSERRLCKTCGAFQKKSTQHSWGRVVGYRWWPLVGRCKKPEQNS